MAIDLIWAELIAGVPDPTHLVRAVLRLLVAMLVGAVVGGQRQQAGKSAGLRTHMLVAMGGALFVLVPLEVGMTWSEVARVIQGLTAGIGFLGAGAILKWHEAHEVQGLTTAAGLWMTAAIGVATGMGRLGTALLGALLTWAVLAIFTRLERPHASPQRT
jgi:putative Mg2+ transporter-C (MgtC) family protein